jgi:uncharacterized protein YceH (UPF0502 family)
MHLLGGSVENTAPASEKAPVAAVPDAGLQDRLAALENLLKSLEERVQALEEGRS